MTATNNSALIRVAVGEASGPHRIMMNHSNISQKDWDGGRSMSCAGWEHKMEFWAYSKKHSGTIRIAVGEADGPHRIMMNHSNISQQGWDEGRSMTCAGWEHKMEFWAYPERRPGTVRIAVGEASGPHRIMMNHSNKSQEDWDGGRSMTYAGWEHKMEFWAYPVKTVTTNSEVTESTIGHFDKFVSEIAVTLNDMDALKGENQERFETLWERMATLTENQKSKLEAVVMHMSSMETNSENKMIHCEEKRVQAANTAKEHQQRAGKLSSDINGLHAKIRQSQSDLSDQKRVLENKTRELKKKQKERNDAALGMIPIVGVFNTIFGGGNPRHLIPGVSMVEAAISAIKGDVETAKHRRNEHACRVKNLQSKKAKSEQDLKNIKKKSVEASNNAQKARGEYRSWETRKNDIGRQLTQVREVIRSLETALSDCNLVRNNKIINVQAWLDYSKSPSLFARKKTFLLGRLKEIKAALVNGGITVDKDVGPIFSHAEARAKVDTWLGKNPGWKWNGQWSTCNGTSYAGMVPL